MATSHGRPGSKSADRMMLDASPGWRQPNSGDPVKTNRVELPPVLDGAVARIQELRMIATKIDQELASHFDRILGADENDPNTEGEYDEPRGTAQALGVALSRLDTTLSRLSRTASRVAVL